MKYHIIRSYAILNPVTIYERTGPHDLPINRERPLIFHELTTMPKGPEGEIVFKELVRRNVTLIPLSWRDEQDPNWMIRVDREIGTIFEWDKAAGDDRYLFYTPCHPLTHHKRPALAFDAETLLRMANHPGFRPHDLEGMYRNVMQILKVDTDAEENAHVINDELSASAEILTRHGFDPVLGLIRLYNELIFNFTELDHNDLMEKIDELVQPLLHRDTITWLREEHDVRIDPEEVWIRAFQTFDARGITESPPEVLIDCSVPITKALFWRDRNGTWQSMEEFTEKALVANPLSVYVSPSSRRISLDDHDNMR